MTEKIEHNAFLTNLIEKKKERERVEREIRQLEYEIFELELENASIGKE